MQGQHALHSAWVAWPSRWRRAFGTATLVSHSSPHAASSSRSHEMWSRRRVCLFLNSDVWAPSHPMRKRCSSCSDTAERHRGPPSALISLLYKRTLQITALRLPRALLGILFFGRITYNSLFRTVCGSLRLTIFPSKFQIMWPRGFSLKLKTSVWGTSTLLNSHWKE